MPVPPRPISSAQLTEARRLYEQTRVAVDDIAAMLGIGPRTFYTRLRHWGWRRRVLRVPTESPPAPPPEPPAPDRSAVPLPVDPAAAERMHAAALDAGAPLAERIQRAVERELAAIERIIAQLRPETVRTEEAERAARVLASLTRTLQDVMRLNTRKEHDDDRGPADTAEFLADMARRMDEFARQGEGSGLPGAGEAETR